MSDSDCFKAPVFAPVDEMIALLFDFAMTLIVFETL